MIIKKFASAFTYLSASLVTAVLIIIALDFALGLVHDRYDYYWELGTVSHIIPESREEYIAKIREEDTIGITPYSPHHYIHHIPNPAHPKNNELGFRGNDLIDFSEGDFLIASFGGSTTQGGDYETTYPRYLEGILNADAGDMRFHVVNASLAGYNMERSFFRYFWHIRQHEPRIITIYHGINDLKRMCEDPYVAEPLDMNWNRMGYIQKTWQDILKDVFRRMKPHSNILRMVLSTRNEKLREVIEEDSELNTAGIQAYVDMAEAFARLAVLDGAKVVFIDFYTPLFEPRFSEENLPKIRTHFASYMGSCFRGNITAGMHYLKAMNNALRDLASNMEGVYFLEDINNRVENNGDFWGDSCHKRPSANEAYARNIKAFLENNLLLGGTTTKVRSNPGGLPNS